MTLPVMLRSRHQLLPEYKSPCVFRALRFCIAAIHFFPARVLLKILTRMLCKGCGDQLEDGNRYAHRVNERVYYSNCCRGCKREQVLTVYHLRKQHFRPPVGTPCDCCGRVDKLQLDHEHSGSRKWRGWVCKSCNIGLGHLGDSSAGLLRALAYLNAAKERESCSTQEANGVVALE